MGVRVTFSNSAKFNWVEKSVLVSGDWCYNGAAICRPVVW